MTVLAIKTSIGLALLTATPALAQDSAKATAGLPVNMLEWFAGLATVLIAILVLAYALRKLGRFSRLDPGAFQVLAALSVGARERVVLLQVGEKQLVLGVAPGQVRNLCELSGEDTIKPSAPTVAVDSFASRLAALRAGKPL